MATWQLASALAITTVTVISCSAATVRKPRGRTGPAGHQQSRGLRSHSEKTHFDVDVNQNNLRTLEDLAILRDFRTLNSSNYRDFDPTQTIQDNADATFKQFIKKLDLLKELTEKEVNKYQERFVVKMEEMAKRDKIVNITIPEAQSQAWKNEVADALEDEKPAVTKGVVDALNNAGLDWEAQDSPDMENVTTKDVVNLLGVTLSNAQIHTLNTTTSKLTPGCQIPETFDARDKWTQCADVIASVHNQGQCGSCWAIATTSAVGGRICITSDGAFTGESAFLSAGYMTSCASEQHPASFGGCESGEPLAALKWLGEQGVPTGGNGWDKMTCVPYFGNGNSLLHFVNPSKAPPCPKSCTSDVYPRSLNEDLFIPRGLKDSHYGQSCDAKKAMVEEGPIVIIFAVYQDFMSYRRGVYSPATRTLAGWHSTTAIGYGSDYILSVNSWGKHWGMKGLFKISNDAVHGYVVPGSIVGSGVGYPFPLPGGNLPSFDLWGKWKLVKGACSINDRGCMESPNYPNGYENSESCTFVAEEDSPPILVEYFSTENDADSITINNVTYSGSKGPAGVKPRGEIIWSSDANVNGVGWRLCPNTDDGSTLLKDHADQGSSCWSPGGWCFLVALLVVVGVLSLAGIVVVRQWQA